ncbi:DUF1289 domain-containing protein [Variovorax sp. J22P240]|uniref:DUF1289 domain-containing protein n=1 Tax=unclassified Variovorax TaxID=663243 RepID=UPI002576B46A|nr:MULTISPECIES: DUF1289 domain-containing protein [unclassified Variovorax]MDM0000639.1 DUF1289 domain-containing protein [Variovorax sp. J22P240]MDM0052877.1 DUF1289 domain-containing protein [Variovorax sp. J22R115]
MSQTDSIADPCISICRMDQDGKFCQGCKRTALEIGAWPRMTERQKTEALASIELRMPFERQPTP